jgi:heterogeneous nuclear ribonucleoprotein L
MRDPEGVEKCIEALDSVNIFKNKIQIKPSKQECLTDMGRAFTLEDGSDSFCDFTRSKHHRYATAQLAAKNRFMPPCKVRS